MSSVNQSEYNITEVLNFTSPAQNRSNSKTLVELNSAEVINRLPVIIFICVLMILGAIGNVHVVYIYFRKFSSSTYRIFVLCLAAIDLVSCFVSMPFEIFDELNPYTFHAEVACKIFRFINFTLAIATGLMLVVIASERYRRICRPFGKQLTVRESIYALAGVVALSIVTMLSALYIYGRKSIEIPGSDLTGSECTWGDHLDGSYIGYLFFGATLLIVIACMVALVVIYVIVGRYLWKHAHKLSANAKKIPFKEAVKLSIIEEETQEDIRRARESFRLSRMHKNGLSSPEDKTSNSDEGKDCLKKGTVNNDAKMSKPYQDKILLLKNTKNPRKTPNRKVNKSTPPFEMKGLQKAFKGVTGRKAGVFPLMAKPEKRVSEREKRITIVLFTITVLYIVSFLPYVIILIVYSTDETYEQNMSKTEHVLYLIGLRLYLVNNVANPFLYSSFDSKFRKHLTDIYSFLKLII